VNPPASVLLLPQTLAASFIWGILNPLFLLDAALTDTQAVAGAGLRLSS